MWRDPELETHLEERLSNSYELYLESIEFIGETIEEIKEELGVNDAEFRARISQPSDSQVSVLARFSQRLFFPPCIDLFHRLLDA